MYSPATPGDVSLHHHWFAVQMSFLQDLEHAMEGLKREMAQEPVTDCSGHGTGSRRRR